MTGVDILGFVFGAFALGALSGALFAYIVESIAAMLG